MTDSLIPSAYTSDTYLRQKVGQELDFITINNSVNPHIVSISPTSETFPNRYVMKLETIRNSLSTEYFEDTFQVTVLAFNGPDLPVPEVVSSDIEPFLQPEPQLELEVDVGFALNFYLGEPTSATGNTV